MTIHRSRSKYHAKKVTVNGITYDSKKEASRHAELLLLERGGAITDLRRQVQFILLPAHYEAYERYGKKGQRLKDGRRCVERAVFYVADFTYKQDGKLVVEDVKSPATRTKDYILKRKMMLHINGIKIREV